MCEDICCGLTWRGMGSDGTQYKWMNPAFIPDRLSPWIKMLMSADVHQVYKGWNNVTITVWNIRTLTKLGILQELTHEMKRYTWHVVELSETLWRGIGKHQTEEGHVLYYSEEINRYMHGAGFLVHKAIERGMLRCCPISNRSITVRLKVSPFNITIIQFCAPSSNHDEDIENSKVLSTK